MSSYTQLSKLLLVAGAVCVAASLGCGAKKPAVATELVEGVVTLDGQPVSGATITFTPVQNGAGAPATGTSDEAGKYSVTAVGTGMAGAMPGAGTLPGEYYVGVVKDEVPEIPQSGDPGYEEPPSGRPASPTITHVVPEQFNNPQTSGIKVTVKPGKNDIPINLKSSK